MSPRLLAVIVAIVLIIAMGAVVTVKRSKPGLRPGDPNSPAATQPKGQ